MAYHVTLAHHLPSILRQGLVPQIGANSQALGEHEARVYAFIDRQAMETALMNWMGEVYEEMEDALGHEVDLVIIEVEDACFERVQDSNGDPFYECYADTTVPPQSFRRITDEAGNTITEGHPFWPAPATL